MWIPPVLMILQRKCLITEYPMAIYRPIFHIPIWQLAYSTPILHHDLCNPNYPAISLSSTCGQLIRSHLPAAPSTVTMATANQ